MADTTEKLIDRMQMELARRRGFVEGYEMALSELLPALQGAANRREQPAVAAPPAREVELAAAPPPAREFGPASEAIIAYVKSHPRASRREILKGTGRSGKGTLDRLVRKGALRTETVDLALREHKQPFVLYYAD